MTLRYREKGGFSSGSDAYTYNGTRYNLSDKIYLQVGEQTKTTDVVTPKFRQRVERGEIINNPFESWNVAKSSTLVGQAFTYGSNSWSYDHGYWGCPSEYWLKWGVDFEQQMLEAQTEARARVASTRTQGVVEAGEARETMELFHLKTWNLIGHLQRERAYATKRGLGNLVAAGRLFRDKWLLYRYGIGPFIGSLENVLIGPDIRTRRETSRGAGSVGGSEIVKTATYSDANTDETWVVSRTWSVSTRAGILYQYDSFRNKWGFSPSELPSAAWELLPWSFVVDWFANTGDFIRALTPQLGITELAAWNGFHSEVRITGTRTSSSVKSPRVMTRSPSGSCLTVIKGNVRRNNCPGPSLYVKPDALGSIATSQRIVDAFALASQLLFR